MDVIAENIEDEWAAAYDRLEEAAGGNAYYFALKSVDEPTARRLLAEACKETA